MAQPSVLYRLIEECLDGTLAEFVAARRATSSWQDIADSIKEATGVEVNRETLRLWFADRLTIEVKVA